MDGNEGAQAMEGEWRVEEMEANNQLNGHDTTASTGGDGEQQEDEEVAESGGEGGSGGGEDEEGDEEGDSKADKEDEEIDDDALEDDKEDSKPAAAATPHKKRGSTPSTKKAKKKGSKAAEDDMDEDERLVAAMPEEERKRIKEIVWAKCPSYPYYPAIIYHPADVEEKLRKKCFNKNTPATHHVVFFYGYGSNSFAAVPFKNVEDWTPENMDKFRLLIAKDKKLPKIMSEAEADLAKPKEDRNPGPKYIRKTARAAKAKELTSSSKKKRQSDQRKSRGGSAEEDDDDDEEEDDDDEEGASDEEGKGKSKRRSRGPGVPIPNKKERALDKIRSWWSKHSKRMPKIASGGDDGSGKKRKRPESSGGAGKPARRKKKKEKKDYGSETKEERFERLFKNVKIMLESKKDNIEKLCITLGKLAVIEGLDLAWTPLRDAIGKVRELRSHQNKAVAAKANEVFNHWKRKHKQQGQPSGAASAADEPREDKKRSREEASPVKKEKKEEEEEKGESAAASSAAASPAAAEVNGRESVGEAEEEEEKRPTKKAKQEEEEATKEEEAATKEEEAAVEEAAPMDVAPPVAEEPSQEHQQADGPAGGDMMEVGPDDGADDHSTVTGANGDASLVSGGGADESVDVSAVSGSSPTPDDDESDAVGGVANPRPFPTPEESSCRHRARTMITTVLGQDQAGSESAAEKIELLVFEARQQLADDKYLMHLRGLCATIKASNELKAKALAGELQPVQEALQAQLEASRK